jgi:hypothetical protein
MSRGGEADQASFNARARSVSSLELLIVTLSPSIEAEPDAPEIRDNVAVRQQISEP